MTENEKLRLLLAEARSALDMWASSWASDRTDLFPRIDAELEKPEIEWTTDTFWGEGAVETCVDGVSISVYPIEWGDDRPWNWTISRHELAESGEAATKEEAVAAALTAAGVK